MVCSTVSLHMARCAPAVREEKQSKTDVFSDLPSVELVWRWCSIQVIRQAGTDAGDQAGLGVQSVYSIQWQIADASMSPSTSSSNTCLLNPSCLATWKVRKTCHLAAL